MSCKKCATVKSLSRAIDSLIKTEISLEKQRLEEGLPYECETIEGLDKVIKDLKILRLEVIKED